MSKTIKNGDSVYVYTMKSSGEVVERMGIVSKHRNNAPLMLVTFDNGQRMVLSSKPTQIHNNTMWSVEPRRNVYVMKMIDVLIGRRETYIERTESINRRLSVLKECGRYGI